MKATSGCTIERIRLLARQGLSWIESPELDPLGLERVSQAGTEVKSRPVTERVLPCSGGVPSLENHSHVAWVRPLSLK